MSQLVLVASVSELDEGDRKIVDVDGTSIGVFNIDGEYYALENLCAHQGGPVCTGKQQGALLGEFEEPGKRVREYFSEDIPAIACPWHGWEYDVRTGKHLGDPEISIETFEVVQDGGELFVEV